MKLGIVGSRSIPSLRFLCKAMSQIDIDLKKVEKIISGGADGADEWAEWWAYKHTIPITVFHAKWNKYGKQAGFLRNIHIVENSDALIALWDGKSKGTKHAIDLAIKKKKDVIVFTCNIDIDGKRIDKICEQLKKPRVFGYHHPFPFV